MWSHNWKRDVSSNKNQVVYQPSNLNGVHIWSYLSPPFLPLSAVTPSCWERCHGSDRELSDSLHPSISLNYGCAAEIANQPLRSAWRGGGDCVNIFWLTKMEGHSEGDGEGGQKIGRKSDVASEGSRRKVLHLTEYALLSLILRLKRKGLQHIYSRLD